MTTFAEPALEVSTIDLIVRRATGLYSLPAVAVEVLRLTESPKVDVRALRESLQQDPALTAKVLRVVNSSLFGLSHSVGDLNEAVGLLGIKQLKLLALGFSLPQRLFLDIAREQLDWYWSSTLARAVAAREVSEQLFKRSGDEAFLAGMMQDLGVLVLLRELGAPYAGLIAETMHRHADLGKLEYSTLGFDHVKLTVGLLEHWKMPDLLVRALAEPRNAKRLARSRDEHAPLARVLHLAELLAALVGHHRLSVLPDLLEAGKLYCELTKSRLNELVASLEPKVRQLANVLSLDIAPGPDYVEILLQAHESMSRLSECVVAPVDPAGERASVRMSDLRNSRPLTVSVSVPEIQAAVAKFLNAPPAAAIEPAAAVADVKRPTREATPRDEQPNTATPTRAHELAWGRNQIADFDVKLTFALGECRAIREPLSVVVVGIQPTAPLEPEQARTVERVLDAACRGAAVHGEPISAPAEGRRAIVLPGRERQEAIMAARSVVERMLQLIGPLSRAAQLGPCVAAAGVATVAEPPKNFVARKLLETAERCLTAAFTSGGVKSLEVI